MRTHRQILKDVGPTNVPARIGREDLKVWTIRSWGHRDSIPSEWWMAFARAEITTLEELAEAAARKSAANDDTRAEKAA